MPKQALTKRDELSFKPVVLMALNWFKYLKCSVVDVRHVLMMVIMIWFILCPKLYINGYCMFYRYKSIFDSPRIDTVG